MSLKIPENGIYKDMPESIYRPVPVPSVSGIKEFKASETPQHYYARNVAPERPERPFNPAFLIGTLTHKRFELGTEEAFNKLHIIAPKGLVRGKGPWLKFLSENKGMTVVKQSDFDLSLAMFRAVMAHPTAKKLVSEGYAEESLFSEYDSEHGRIKIKGRTDFRNPKRKCIVDFKTARTASESDVASFGGPKSFSRDAYNSKYHWQVAFYLELIRSLTGEEYKFYFISVEKEYPHGVNVFEMPKDLIEEGHKEVFSALKELDQCFKTNTWEGYGDDIKVINPPSFMRKKKESPFYVADRLSKSELIPKEFSSPENIFLLLNASKALGCDFLELVNNCYIRNGKVAYGSAFLIAQANKSKNITGIKYLVTEDKDDTVVTAFTDKDDVRIQSSVSLKTAREQWNNSLYKNKYLAIHCLKLRAANWLIRSYMPEITAMTTLEEQNDIQYNKQIKGN